MSLLTFDLLTSNSRSYPYMIVRTITMYLVPETRIIMAIT